MTNIITHWREIQTVECVYKLNKAVTKELNKVSSLITRAWTGLRQEKPWPIAGSRCDGPKGGGPLFEQTPKLRADRPTLLSVAAAQCVFRRSPGHNAIPYNGRIRCMFHIVKTTCVEFNAVLFGLYNECYTVFICSKCRGFFFFTAWFSHGSISCICTKITLELMKAISWGRQKEKS